MDDPYWVEFIEENSRSEDRWRSTSILALDHKLYSIIGEVVDVASARKKAEKYHNMF